MNHNPDPLKALLNEWSELPRPEGPVTVGAVWARLDGQQTTSGWKRWLQSSIWEVDGLLSRPRVFAAVVVVGFCLGLAFAQLNLHLDVLRGDGEMTNRYLSLFELSRR